MVYFHLRLSWRPRWNRISSLEIREAQVRGSIHSSRFPSQRIRRGRHSEWQNIWTGNFLDLVFEGFLLMVKLLSTYFIQTSGGYVARDIQTHTLGFRLELPREKIKTMKITTFVGRIYNPEIEGGERSDVETSIKNRFISIRFFMASF